jgi:hypothetical protein
MRAHLSTKGKFSLSTTKAVVKTVVGGVVVAAAIRTIVYEAEYRKNLPKNWYDNISTESKNFRK